MVKKILLGAGCTILLLIGNGMSYVDDATDYTLPATVVKVEGRKVTFDDGHDTWVASAFGLHKGDRVILSMDDNGTPEDVYDDIILEVDKY